MGERRTLPQVVTEYVLLVRVTRRLDNGRNRRRRMTLGIGCTLVNLNGVTVFVQVGHGQRNLTAGNHITRLVIAQVVWRMVEGVLQRRRKVASEQLVAMSAGDTAFVGGSIHTARESSQDGRSHRIKREGELHGVG